MFDDIWPTWCEYLRPCTCCTWETWEKQASHSQLCSICKRGSKGFDWDIRLSDYQANNGPIYPPWYFSGSLKIKVMMVHQPKRRLFARTVIYVSKYELLTHPFIASVILQISHHISWCFVPLSDWNPIPMNNIEDYEDITHHSTATLPERAAACCKASWCIWQKSNRATLALEFLTQLMAAFHVMTSAAA